MIGQLYKKIISLETHFYTANNREKYFQKKGFKVGKGNRIAIKQIGNEPYLVKIGNHNTISAEVEFITHDGGSWVLKPEIPEITPIFGKIEVTDNCFIGFRSIIMPNVTIGPNSVVGAGSVVTKNVPKNTVVAGIPAKKICSIDEYKEKCSMRWNKQPLQGPRNTWEKQLKKYLEIK